MKTGKPRTCSMTHIARVVEKQERKCGLCKYKTNDVLCHRVGHAQAVLLLETGQLFRVRAQQGAHCRLLALHHLLQTRFPSTPRTRQDGLLDRTGQMATSKVNSSFMALSTANRLQAIECR